MVILMAKEYRHQQYGVVEEALTRAGDGFPCYTYEKGFTGYIVIVQFNFLVHGTAHSNHMEILLQLKCCCLIHSLCQ